MVESALEQDFAGLANWSSCFAASFRFGLSGGSSGKIRVLLKGVAEAIEYNITLTRCIPSHSAYQYASTGTLPSPTTLPHEEHGIILIWTMIHLLLRSIY